MKKEIIEFIKRIFFFTLFTLGFYILTLCLAGDFLTQKITKNLIYKYGAVGQSLNRFNEVKKVKNIDILFLGSSHTYRGFDNRIFKNHGFSSFNLGSSSQTPMQTSILLDRYLNQLNPQIVIYEVYPITFTLDGLESALDLVTNDQNDFASLKMALNLNHIKLYNSLIYSTYRQLTNRNKLTDAKSIIGNDHYISGGFVEKTKSNYKPKTTSKTTLEFNLKQLKLFKENLEKIETHGAEVILIQAPITADHSQSFTNYTQLDTLMNKHNNYYNFNQLIQLTDSLHFFDAHHLNQKGVEIFNNKLIEVIPLKVK